MAQWQQVHDSSLLARALPLFRGLADLTLDERNFTDTTGELRDLLSALQPNAAPALAHLRCRRSKVTQPRVQVYVDVFIFRAPAACGAAAPGRTHGAAWQFQVENVCACRSGTKLPAARRQA